MSIKPNHLTETTVFQRTILKLAPYLMIDRLFWQTFCIAKSANACGHTMPVPSLFQRTTHSARQFQSAVHHIREQQILKLPFEILH